MTEENQTESQIENQEEEIVRFKLSWQTVIPWISIVAIALGQLNDTWDGVLKIWEFGQSTMTDQPSRNRLNKIYINASGDILEETFGAPIYIKEAINGNEIRYYRDKHYILSAVKKDGIIAAYLVFPFEGFEADTDEHAGGKNYLKQPFISHPNLVESHSNIASIGNYYIEEITGGKFDMLYSSVGGVSEYLGSINTDKMKLLATYNDKAMMEEDTTSALKNIREKFLPNFYGYSSIGIVELEQAILTHLEYELITNKAG